MGEYYTPLDQLRDRQTALYLESVLDQLDSAIGVARDLLDAGPISPSTLLLAHFSARVSTNTGGVTGNGTAYTILFDTADVANAAYATDTGIYTALETGAYMFNIAVGMVAGGAAQTSGKLQLVTTARTYRWDFDPYTSRNLASGVYSWGGSLVVDMTANDTAKVVLTITGGPADSAIVTGTGTTLFSGFRIA